MKGSRGSESVPPVESQPAARSAGCRQAEIGNRKERFCAPMRVPRGGSPTYPID